MKKASFASVCCILLGASFAQAELSLNAPLELRKAVDALCGDSAERDPKMYLLIGQEPGTDDVILLGGQSDVQMLRDDLNSLFPTLSVRAERLTGTRNVAQIKLTGLLDRTIVRTQAGRLGVFTRERSKSQTLVAFFGPGGERFETMNFINLRSALRDNAEKSTHQECERLRPVVKFGWNEGQELATRAERSYNSSRQTTRGRRKPSQTLYTGDCGLASETLLDCTFDSHGTGSDDQPQLEATFEISGGKIGRILRLQYNSTR